MGSGSSHHTTRSSAKPSPTGAAATASSPSEPNPNLCHAATAAMAAFYTSPVTGPQLERSQPPVTRGGEAAAQADLRQRMANVKPKGRVQRTVQLSEAEQRAWNAEQARRRRAQAKVREVIFTKFMRDLERTQLRALLLLAGREGKLAFQDGAMLHDFVESADDAATSAELDELDDTE